MASARIEFVRLAMGHGETRNYVNTIHSVYGVADLEVTSTATVAASRPTAPTFDSYTRGHARVTAIGAPIIVAFGDNPTASAAGLGIRIEAGATDVLPVLVGQKLSFILA